MTVSPSDYLPHSQPRSGESLHTQESGDAGLSSNMVHKFCYNYEESTLPVTDTGTGNCVRPIPKAETDMNQLPVMAHPYSPASTEERFLSTGKSSLADMQTGLDSNLPHHRVDTDLADNGKEEEMVKAIPGTATITEAFMQHEGGNGNIEDADMDARRKRGNTSSVDEERKRNMKRAGGKKWKVYPLCVVAVLLINFPACKGSDGGQNCFVCKDEGKCPMLSVIFNERDKILYERNNTGAFPACPEMPPPVPNTPETCTVCQAQQTIIISCSNDTNEIQPEANGSLIQDIAKTCQQYKTSDPATSGGTSHYIFGWEHTGLLCRAVLCVIVVRALMIC